MPKLRGAFFDLHNTLAYLKERVELHEVSQLLAKFGYRVSPQAWRASLHFVSIVQLPREGISSYDEYLRRALLNLGVDPEEKALEELRKLYEEGEQYVLFPDARPALEAVKELGLKTAVVTTIPKFKFASVLEELEGLLDYVMTGVEAGCDKSDPRMYSKLLQLLELKPSEVAVVGDEPYVDVWLPKSLGMTAIHLARNMDPAPEADFSARSLTEAAEIVARLASKRRS